MANLERVARGTGGRTFRLVPTDPTLSALASAIEGMEQRSQAREFSYRRKERFQVPLAIGLGALALALALPLPPLRLRLRAAAAVVLLCAGPRAASPTGRRRRTSCAAPTPDRAGASSTPPETPQGASAFEPAAARRKTGRALKWRKPLKDEVREQHVVSRDRAGCALPLAAPARFKLGMHSSESRTIAERSGLRERARRTGDLDTRRNVEMVCARCKSSRNSNKRQQQERKTGQNKDQDQDKDKKKEQGETGQGQKPEGRSNPDAQEREEERSGSRRDARTRDAALEALREREGGAAQAPPGQAARRRAEGWWALSGAARRAALWRLVRPPPPPRQRSARVDARRLGVQDQPL